MFATILLGQIHGIRSLSGSGTTRGTTTPASLTMMSNDEEYMGPPGTDAADAAADAVASAATAEAAVTKLAAAEPATHAAKLAVAEAAATKLAAVETATHAAKLAEAEAEWNNDDTVALEAVPCVKSEGTFDSQTDFCYSCGGTSDTGSLGYCWNSQPMQCPPKCGNVKGASGIGDNQCGGACDNFLSYKKAPTIQLCHAMGYHWAMDNVGVSHCSQFPTALKNVLENTFLRRI